MFLATEPLQFRERRIRDFLKRDPSVSLLLAAVHFEWTVCRAMLFLSTGPNADLRRQMDSVYGLDRYKEFWRDDLHPVSSVDPLPDVVRNWQQVRAFLWRNRLIHGRDSCTRNMAAPRVEVLIAGAAYVWQYAQQRGIDLSSRLPVRRAQRRKHSHDAG
jgi:hypothetical protein